MIASYEASDIPTSPAVFLCEAQIYRGLGDPFGTEFTEEWRLFAWPFDQNGDGQINTVDGEFYCTARLAEYMNDYLAPGLPWQFRDLRAVGVSDKSRATDCLGLPPPTYGAPLGAEINWSNPPPAQASAWVRLQIKCSECPTGRCDCFDNATPQVQRAIVRFAERTGLPDPNTSAYDLDRRHLRFFDMFISLGAFSFPTIGVTVQELSIQSVGTVIAEHVGGSDYRVLRGFGKFYMKAIGTDGDHSATDSRCFFNSEIVSFRVSQGPPFSFFSFVFQSNQIGGQPLDVRISLSSPASASTQFTAHQPVVGLVDKQIAGPRVRLTPDLVLDHDDDEQFYLWFEDFEKPTERLLGAGSLPSITDVPFDVGDHHVTLVAYDARGVYNSGSMTLTVTDANDVCLDAEAVLQPLPATHLGSTNRATWDDAPTCDGVTNTAPGVWYTVVGTGRILTASLCNDQTAWDAKLSVFCGGCGRQRCIAANDDSCGLLPEVSWCSGLGTIYHILVHGHQNSKGDYQLDVRGDGPECQFSVFCGPSYNACTNALDVTEGIVFVDNTSAGEDTPVSCVDSKHDTWFRYTPTCDGIATISTCEAGGTLDDTVLAVFDECLGQELACMDDTFGCGLRQRLELPVQGNTSILIRVASFGGATFPNDQGTFPLSIHVDCFCGDGFCDSNGGENNCNCPLDCIHERCDNCLFEENEDQRDTDGDGFGNRCDPDLNNDCVVGIADLAILLQCFGRSRGQIGFEERCDLNGDGVVNDTDYGIYQHFFGKPPGPSGKAACS